MAVVVEMGPIPSPFTPDCCRQKRHSNIALAAGATPVHLRTRRVSWSVASRLHLSPQLSPDYDDVLLHLKDLCEQHFRIAWSRSDATIRSMFLSCARQLANRHRRSRSGFRGAMATIQWRKAWNGFYDPANDGMRNMSFISVSSILRLELSWAVSGSMS